MNKMSTSIHLGAGILSTAITSPTLKFPSELTDVGARMGFEPSIY
jgi:hypothetical protein